MNRIAISAIRAADAQVKKIGMRPLQRAPAQGPGHRPDRGRAYPLAQRSRTLGQRAHQFCEAYAYRASGAGSAARWRRQSMCVPARAFGEIASRMMRLSESPLPA